MAGCARLRGMSSIEGGLAEYGGVFLWGFDSVYLWFCFCWLGTWPIGLPCHGTSLDAGLSD